MLNVTCNKLNNVCLPVAKPTSDENGSEDEETDKEQSEDDSKVKQDPKVDSQNYEEDKKDEANQQEVPTVVNADQQEAASVKPIAQKPRIKIDMTGFDKELAEKMAQFKLQNQMDALKI